MFDPRIRTARNAPYAAAALVTGLLLTLLPSRADSIPPELLSDEGASVVVPVQEGGKSTLTAWGGSTDAPPNDMGRPPWTWTGNRLYTWHVTQSATDEGLHLETSPSDGETTTSPTIVIFLDNPGSVEVTLSIQDEYQDSSESPVIVWWSENPE